MRYILVLAVVSALISCDSQRKAEKPMETEPLEKYVTPLGREYMKTAAPLPLVQKYDEAKAAYESAPEDLDSIIWYGRRTAYLGEYGDAIDIYTKGLELYPNEPRLYRHRGHRYISMREYDRAIADLSKAEELIQGTENVMEQDGMPNARNIPVSSLHGNIYYHLGLAHYLKQDFPKALEAYEKCKASLNNNDNLISSTHWLYMIHRRMGDEAAAQKVLEPVTKDMDIIENFAYHNICLYYKELISRDELESMDGSSGDALLYGIANYDFYNGKKDAARITLEKILSRPSYTSFGYLAAESDYMHYFSDL